MTVLTTLTNSLRFFFKEVFLSFRVLFSFLFKLSKPFSQFIYIDKNNEKNLYINYKFSLFRYYYNSFYNLDYFYFYFFSKKYLLSNKTNRPFRSNLRVFSTNFGFYTNLVNKKLSQKLNLISFLSGFKYLWNGLKFWLFPLIVLFLVIYFTIVLRSLPFNKVVFGWICILMFIYWLISGFVFFFKKYQFGKYTTAVQRFWRRSYILFWMIEGGTFLVFLFFTFNSSQESFYMYDQINIFKTHLYSWKFFLVKLFPSVILIVTSYLLIISVKWNLYNKQSIILLVITFFLSYMVWLEFYQFFHVLNFYSNLNWIYDVEDHVWSLDLEPRKTRMLNHYVMLLFILKFWHIIFIYGFWIFFVLRCWETKRIRFPLLSANFQNFIILYIFAWVFMYPWFKFFFRKFLDAPYYWFYLNNRKFFFRVFFNDLKVFYYGLTFFLKSLNQNFLFFFKTNEFYYWKNLDYDSNFSSYKKYFIKEKILTSLNSK